MSHLDTTTDEIVSSDIVGMRYGSLFDATQTMVMPLDNGTTQVQVVSWYDNENSYTSQMVRTIKYFSELSIMIYEYFIKDSQRVRSNMDRILFL